MEVRMTRDPVFIRDNRAINAFTCIVVVALIVSLVALTLSGCTSTHDAVPKIESGVEATLPQKIEADVRIVKSAAEMLHGVGHLVQAVKDRIGLGKKSEKSVSVSDTIRAKGEAKVPDKQTAWEREKLSGINSIKVGLVAVLAGMVLLGTIFYVVNRKRKPS